VIVLHVREHEVTWGADIDVETADEARRLVDEVTRELKDADTNVRGEVVRVPSGRRPARSSTWRTKRTSASS